MANSSARQNGSKLQNIYYSGINEGINPPHIMPRKEVVIGVATQDVQLSGSMIRLHGYRLKAGMTIYHWITAFAGMPDKPESANSKTSHTLHYHSHPNTASPDHPETPETRGAPRQEPEYPSTRDHRQRHDCDSETD